MIITLCGSTKYKELFESIAKKLTLKGHIILSCSCFYHKETNKLLKKKIEKKKVLLDKIHRDKIAMSNLIIVLNKNGYIGLSTRKEIFYALSKNKKVLFLENNKTLFEIKKELIK